MVLIFEDVSPWDGEVRKAFVDARGSRETLNFQGTAHLLGGGSARWVFRNCYPLAFPELAGRWLVMDAQGTQSASIAVSGPCAARYVERDA